MKKKVLFITTQFNQGGVEKTLIEAARAINPEKYDLTLLLRNDKTDLVPLLPDYVKVVVDKDGHYYRKPKAVVYKTAEKLFSAVGSKAQAKKFKALHKAFIEDCKIKNPAKTLFKNEHFDIVISYTVHLCTAMALEISADKYYCFFHSDCGDFHEDITSRCFPKYDKIVACGPGVEVLLRETFPELDDKIMLLSNYVDAPAIVEKAKAFNPYKNDGDKLIICSCARLAIEKGFDMAVKAAAILRDKGIDFKWYIVGGGEERENIENLIRENNLVDTVIMMGNQPNPFPYLKNCDIYVQPSYKEAQPLAILESVVLGKAIVSTKTIGGVTILKDGVTGLISEYSPESIAEKVLVLINNPELKASFENLYTLEQNKKEKEQYIINWENLLSM